MLYNLEQSFAAMSMSQTWFWILLIWSVIWKGLALWKAAQKGSKPWFILFLVVNTAGILEILYLFVFSSWKSKKVEEPHQHKHEHDHNHEEKEGE